MSLHTSPEDIPPTEGMELTPSAERILDVASELFYRRGIHAVGVDTIAAESGVTKRTLYNQFGSKDDLVAAYLQSRDTRWRDLITAGVEAKRDEPAKAALVPFDILPGWLTSDFGNRGCSFINAYGELPDPDHPGHQIIVAQKQWLRELFHTLLNGAGAIDVDTLAAQFLSLHEGAIVSYSITNDRTAPFTARAAAETLLQQAMPEV